MNKRRESSNSRSAFFLGFVVLAMISYNFVPVLHFFPGAERRPFLTEGLAFAADLRPEEIVTVLPKDAIPAILSPSFEEAKKSSWLDDTDLVIGVEIGGDSRAYPVATLSRHEIVNDRVGGAAFAVTW